MSIKLIIKEYIIQYIKDGVVAHKRIFPGVYIDCQDPSQQSWLEFSKSGFYQCRDKRKDERWRVGHLEYKNIIWSKENQCCFVKYTHRHTYAISSFHL